MILTHHYIHLVADTEATADEAGSIDIKHTVSRVLWMPLELCAVRTAFGAGGYLPKEYHPQGTL